MTEKFNGFTNVLVIDDRTDTRTVTREVLSELGLKPVALPCVAEGFDYLQNQEPPDWIITCLDKSEKINAFHLMMLILDRPELKNVRVSLTLNKDEEDFIPAAFELGCLSYHFRPFTKQSLQTELQILVDGLKEDYRQHALVAAGYIREFLNEKEAYTNLIELEESIIPGYPDETDLYLKLAEAQILNGDAEQARKILWQAKYLGKDLEVGVKQLKDLIEIETDGEVTLDFENATFADAFDVKEIVLVDPDEASITQVKEVLSGAGIEQITTFPDGKQAFDYLKEAKLLPSAVIQEWKIPEVSGPALIQRLRNLDEFYVPIFVLSSLLKDEDEYLVKEMGAADIIKKPIINEIFLNSLMSKLREEIISTNFDSLARKINMAFVAEDAKSAEESYKKFIALNDVPAGTAKLVSAQMSYLQGDLDKAKAQALETFKIDGESVATLNVLGKIFLKVGDSESALKCLNRAQRYSSENLSRMCMMAEAHSECGDSDAAKEILDDAMDIDAESEMVIETSAKVAINANDSEGAKEMLIGLDSLSGVLAYTNNRAVLLAREEKFGESIELYNSMIGSIPEEKERESCIVKYNLGLAYARMNRLGDAEGVLNNIEAKTFPSLKTKISSLTKRVKKAMTDGKKLKLNSLSMADRIKNLKANHDSDVQIPTAFHIDPGELCLHLYYVAGDFFTEESKELVKNMPKLLKREDDKEAG